MNTCETPEAAAVASTGRQELRLPLGLLGFENTKQYLLISDPQDAPFQWLQVADDPGLAFLVLSPFEVVPDYELNLGDEDVRFLQLDSARDALVYNIVTLHAGGKATINLKGPIVINRRTWVGKQVVLGDARGYSLQHPIVTTG